MKPTNDAFLRALCREKTDFTPLWLMRQAGRYLPEYCETRARAGSFMGLAQNPDYATEVTLQPIDRYGLDAAILFSDILTVPDAMGLGLSFVQGEGPVFAKPVQDEAAVAQLAAPDPNVELKYVMDAVSSIRKALNNRVPLIGFSGSPFTLACYMVEGRGSRDFRTVKTMMYRRPDLFHRILEVNAEAVALYLNAQIKAGAQAVQIFDTWGGMLADGDFQTFSLAYTKKVVEKLIRENDGAKVPSIVFTKGGGEWIADIASIGCDAVGLDWSVNLTRARSVVGDRVALQGNLDPFVLFGDEETIRREARRVLDAYGEVGAGGHVFNLGHGINQFTPVENVRILVDEVHSYSRRHH
ncbi:MAG: uroporphyrinogen decarboxylase [Sutterella parvirubra]|uniref:Uroporphyrinogen decarboxylase n=1 Tax=Sutterella parvirubra YIT 11816 TaxID=762967 RepID=H3KBB2_9BURK|nr:uroporphyrinogen decarboxylase [Sutterella parvirubra]EHY32545.1 uroporphyrinogen decarboxylase [Sutterella parvirubra YIT 11816]MCI7709413.1 uroporphyrinogen decarboxylase [Sutterella parvirubra]MDR3771157.1 uroporphyrinogen decarboxylase [Sutterella sp.]MDY5200560.1 uroporphyrinogen decarboxylase [Sutterella parvirubra]